MENELQSLHGMYEAVLDVQNGNKCILERITQMFPEEESDSCRYTSKSTEEDTLKELLARVQELEERNAQTNDALHTMRQQINYLQKSKPQVCDSSNVKHQIKGTKEANSVMKLDPDVSNIQLTKHQQHSDNDRDAAVTKSDPADKDMSAHKQQENDTENAETLVKQEHKIENNAFVKEAKHEIIPDFDNSRDILEPNAEAVLSVNTSALKQSSEAVKGHESGTDYSIKTAEAGKGSVVMDKPNFTKRSAVQKTGVKLVDQTEPKYHSSYMVWGLKEAEEHKAGRELLNTQDGIHNVICIDISASMAEGEAWIQAKTFFTDYISGLEHIAIKYDLKEDNVALVTFGHETRVVQRLTKDFSIIRQAFDNIKLGGPTPMYGGVSMAMAAAQSSRVQAVVNGTQMFRKIILITDGKPTDGNMYAGPDVGDSSMLEETKSDLLRKVSSFQSNNVDLFCVHVGNGNTDFLELLASRSNGKVIDFRGGRKLSKLLVHTVMASQEQQSGMLSLGSLLGSSGSMLDSSSTLSENLEQMKEILEGQNKFLEALKKGQANEFVHYLEGNSDTLPPVGSRVTRGPDWKYADQDSQGPGTVIGNNPLGGQLWVEWDANEHQNVYCYGGNSDYDVLVTDAAREIPPGHKIAVGCVVKPGPHWKDGHAKVDVDERGVVIKEMLDAKKVQVRWNNHARGDYSYGEDGVYEVELSQKSPPETTFYGQPTEKIPLKKKNKKNKNSVCDTAISLAP